MLRWAFVAAALIALVPSWPAVAATTGPVRLAARFDPDARLGAPTALNIALRVDPRRVRSPLAAIRLRYPASLGLVSSGLGLATCTRPASDFAAVLIPIEVGIGGCPPNAVMGYGTVRADVRLTDGQVIPEYATLTILSGPLARDSLGLVFFVDGQRPFAAKLVLAGELRDAGGRYGSITARLPAIPKLDGMAVVALVHLHLSIGSPRITYYERRGGRTVAYHPDGVVLPNRCPSGGFHFGAWLAFDDGTEATASATVRCKALLAPAMSAR